jgi:hypothetical protein
MSDTPHQNAIEAFHLTGCKVRCITPASDPAEPLPETLVVAPGEYSVMGQEYSLHAEGLYRFLHPMVENRQCIVFEKDVIALMSAVGWLATHGYRDNGKSFEEVEEIARRGKIVLTCGDCSRFATQLLGALKIPIRTVQVRTLQECNGYNDGHVLTEVQLEGKWVVYDPDNSGSLFSSQGRRLNLVELIQRMRHNDYRREPLAANVNVAIGLFSREGYDYDLWYETVAADADLWRESYHRVMMIPIISENGQPYFTAFSEEERRRALELHTNCDLAYLSPEEFTARFYPAVPKEHQCR